MDGARVALVVANDEYADPGLRRLTAPAHDAAALAEVLADPAVGGFGVQVLRNESAQGIRFAVEDFFADRSPEDLLLLHFSCHGLKNAAGELFLAVADTQPTRLASTAVAADFVNRQMADSRAQRIALFLDCCYGGAFPRGLVVRATGEAQVRDAFAGQDRVGGGRGRVVVTASSAMEYAFEGGQLAADASRPSVFTSAVVDGLTSGEADRDGDGWVGITELVGYVTDRVHRVTPNQHPQMWTFGSSGELLIARSRVRRITPAELAPELLDAMESPLSATRYGVVDYLRDRLSDPDLGLAYAAWQALGRMTDDDSRKVSDTARQALSEAALQVAPAELHLTASALEADLQLSGPPLALTATATTPAPWLTLNQSGTTIRVTAASPSPSPGPHTAEIHLESPTGTRTVPVHLAASEPARRQPARAVPLAEAKPKVRPKPAAAAPAAQPVESVETQPRTVPGWLIGVLIVGAGLLIWLNWPGPPQTNKIWYSSDTGWHVYRSWTDPEILASLAALVAAVIAASARQSAAVALGVVLGCVLSVGEDGVLIVASEIADSAIRNWLAAGTIAGLMALAILLVLRPRRSPLWPVPLPAALLVVAGGIFQVISATTPHGDGVSFLTVTPLALLEPVVIVALAWLTITATEHSAKSWLTATTVTYAIISMIAGIPAYTEGDSAPALLTGLLGNALVIAGVAVAYRRGTLKP